MWELQHNYPLKLMSCVSLSFSIFVSSELMITKYKETNINKL